MLTKIAEDFYLDLEQVVYFDTSHDEGEPDCNLVYLKDSTRLILSDRAANALKNMLEPVVWPNE